MDIGSLTGTISIEDQLSGALSIVASNVAKFAEGFEGAFGTIGVAIGVGVGAVTAFTAAVTALGVKGADVNDVTSTFEHFSGSAAEATANLQALQEGTLGTVGKLDLMKASSKLLAAGVKLTAEDFKTMGSAAFVLQNQGLGPTKDMLNLVSQALLTGQTRMLRHTIGVIDLTKAETDLKHSLGVSELTQSQKAIADRTAILEAMRKKVVEAGMQERDFGEQIEFARAKVDDFFDDLASTVAKSPVLKAAMDSIAQSFQTAFGSGNEELIKTIVHWIELGAVQMVNFGIAGLEAAREIHTGWEGLMTLLSGVGTIIAGAVSGTLNAASALANLGAKGPFAGAFEKKQAADTAAAAKEATAIFEQLKSTMKEYAASTVAGATGQDAFSKKVQAGEAALFQLKDSMNAAMTAQEKAGGVTARHTAATKELTAAQQEYQKQLDAMIKKFTDASVEGQLFADAFKSLTPAQKANADVQALLIPQFEKMIAAHKDLTPAMQAVYDQSQALKRSYLDQEVSLLQLSGLTQEQVDRAKEQGDTEAQIAHRYEASTQALGLYLAEKQKDLKISSDLAAFEEKGRADQAAADARQRADSLAANQAATNVYKDLREKNYQAALTDTEKQIRLAELQRDKSIAAAMGQKDVESDIRKAAIAEAETDYATQYFAIKETEQATTDAIIIEYQKRKKAEQTFHNLIMEDLKAIPGLVVQAFTGGGGLGGALKGIGSMVGSTIGDVVGSGIKMLGSLGGPIGAAIGSLLGPAIGALGKLLGIGPTEYEKRMKAAVDQTKSLQQQLVKSHGSMQQLILDADLVGINIKEAFNWKDPAAFQTVVDQLQAKTQLLNDAMTEYGFTWQDLGDKARTAKLGELFDELYAKTDVLRTAGIDYHEILLRQAKDYSDLVNAAIRTGTEIPQSMQQTLQDLVDMGDLIDENGNAFTDLSKVQWAKTLTQGFDEVTDAIKALTDALLNGVGGAIDTINNKSINVKVNYSENNAPTTGNEEPTYAAAGGRVLPWRPRGTDTVPAMLTPGETVIPAGRSSEQPIDNAITLKIGNEVLTRQVIKTLVKAGL